MFGTFQIFFYNNNNTQTIIWRITWELQPMFTCTRFGLLKFVSKWQLPTTCSKRSRIGEFGISLFSNGFLVALLVPITHFVSFPLTRRFILRDSFHCKFHRRWRQLMRVFQFLQTLKNLRGSPCGHHIRASGRIFRDKFYTQPYSYVPCWTLWVQDIVCSSVRKT